MLLEKLNLPEALKTISRSDLPLLCEELREVLLKQVSKNGGHLASNLGVVELTMMLHRVFDLPRDQIIWDVGHQSYVHKLLSGPLVLLINLQLFQLTRYFYYRTDKLSYIH